jgi:tetratricopeptide (TPR) repeat protein
MNRTSTLVLALVVGSWLGCTGPGSAGAVRGGEQYLDAQDFAAAEEAFRNSLSGDLNAAERERAQVGLAQALIGLNRLDDAQQTLEQVGEHVSGRWYFLGDIAVRRGDRAEARRTFTKALDLNHAGDTSIRLAWAIAGEAQTRPPVLRAAAVLDRGGKKEMTAAVVALEATWRELDNGGPPGPLLARVEAEVLPLVGDYGSAQVLAARLMELVGRTGDADEAWDLSRLSLPPSLSFVRYAATLRAHGALAAEQPDRLKAALEVGDSEAIAQFRRWLAEDRFDRGDIRGALDLLRDSVEANQGSGPALPDLPLVALLEDRLGLDSAPSWRRAETAAWRGGPDVLQARVSLHLAESGDVLGAAEMISRLESPRELPSAEQADLARARRVAGLVERGLEAYRRGQAQRVVSVARAVRLLIPAEPAVTAMELAIAEPAPRRQVELLVGARGMTEQALDELRLEVLLRAGDLEAAGQLLEATRQRLDVHLQLHVFHGLTAALTLPEGARQADVFLRAQRSRLEPRTLALLRSDARLATLDDGALPSPRGLAGRPQGQGWGRLVAANGLYLGPVRIERRPEDRLKGELWDVTFPEGALGETRADDLEARLGAPLGQVGWRADTGGPLDDAALDLARGRVEEVQGTARRPPWRVAPPVLEID